LEAEVAKSLHEQARGKAFMENSENTGHRRKVAIATLILITPFTTLMPYMAVSVLMNEIMESLDVGLALAGFSMTVMLVISGICMFLGSGIQVRIGIKNTIILAIWLISIGNGISFVAWDFIVFFMGRLVSGIGFGLVYVSMLPFLSIWFTDKPRTVMITANLLANSLASVLGVSIANPLMELTGSWYGVFGIYSLFVAAIAASWMVFGRSNPNLESTNNLSDNNRLKKDKSIIRKAFEVRQFRIIMLCSIFIMLAMTAFTAFLPVFLQNARGFTVGLSVVSTNVLNVTFVVGTLIGGYLVARTGRRKVIFQTGILIMTLGGAIFVFATTAIPVMISVALIGTGFMVRMPAQTTITMETLSPPDPIVLGGALALISGFAQIASLVVAPSFAALTERFDMVIAMQALSSVLIISVVLSFAVKETSPQIP